MIMEVLNIKDLSKSFSGVKVLSKLNLSVIEGDMIAIIGGSGKGKTTLLNIIGLIADKDEGDIKIFDYINPSINSKEAMLLRRNNIGYLFQNFALVEEETVFWNLDLALEYKKINKKQRIKLIEDQLKKFNLMGLKNKKVYQLSGGEQQRIAIIRLILQDSKLILADEPTASLDKVNEEIIMKSLKDLNNEGKTIIVVTHNDNILQYFNRIISLEDI